MTTVLDSFVGFRRNLELNDLQESTVAKRQQAVREAVERELTVVAAFLIGSYRRHTLIAPLAQADVDIMIVLDRALRKTGPAAVLDKVKGVLLRSYPNSKISRNGQAVTIQFSEFIVDVVPAFKVPLWADGSGWEICGPDGKTWLQTNPERHRARSAQANDATGGFLVPTVKMVKSWNRTAGCPLRSFHIEVLAWSIFDPRGLQRPWFGIEMGTDPENISYFFQEASKRLAEPLPDPARGKGDVGSYLSVSDRRDAIAKINIALKRCELARTLVQGHDQTAANEVYRQVFGNLFPL